MYTAALAATVRASARPMRGSSPGPQVPPCRGFSFSAAHRRARSPCESPPGARRGTLQARRAAAPV